MRTDQGSLTQFERITQAAGYNALYREVFDRMSHLQADGPKPEYADPLQRIHQLSRVSHITYGNTDIYTTQWVRKKDPRTRVDRSVSITSGYNASLSFTHSIVRIHSNGKESVVSPGVASLTIVDTQQTLDYIDTELKTTLQWLPKDVRLPIAAARIREY
ncbi:MAG: hypothetical protein RLZZ455_225 [Candidatus Parcubacteria bacterium]|jgi:hypothetical protein